MTAPAGIESIGGIGVISAATLALLGVPLQPIIWALVGGFFGAGLAKPSSLLVASASYLSASLLSALIGHAVTTSLALVPLAGNMIAALTAVGFHPALTWFIQKVPDILNWVFSLRPGRGSP